MYVFFDLDGTLTDSKEGITRSVQHALRHFGIDEPDTAKLTPYIGPPLKDSFEQYHGLTREQADEALLVYRERYADVGIFENRVYDGIPALLAALRAADCSLAVTTSKPLLYTEQILAHFKLDTAFDAVIGCDMSERNTSKATLIADALHRFGCAPAQAWMVGDRCFDIEGAHENGVRAVGVRYGFAAPDELEQAGADVIVGSVAELQAFLLAQCDTESNK